MITAIVLIRTRVDRVGRVPGVAATATRVAFRTHPRHDLQAACALGPDR